MTVRYYKLRQNVITNYGKCYYKLRQLYYKLRQCVITNNGSFIKLLQITAAFRVITNYDRYYILRRYYKLRRTTYPPIILLPIEKT